MVCGGSSLTSLVLAPSNAAFTNYLNQPHTTAFNNDTLRALLHYHAVQDVFASATFATGPFFPATLLTNKTSTNVTGGQVVEITTTSAGKPVVLSAIKAASNIIEPVSPVATEFGLHLTGLRTYSTLEA